MGKSLDHSNKDDDDDAFLPFFFLICCIVEEPIPFSPFVRSGKCTSELGKRGSSGDFIERFRGSLFLSLRVRNLERSRMSLFDPVVMLMIMMGNPT